ncbi:hypothetical protein T4C_598 [Trichinella pseudospiralis]|uniref:DUF5641 domain-containing protein n=1 Tax=Trichinella pseudospiralis TaxID=6337 RepID=A0A0V1ISZ7_TRIPS|nr:hypothetical protein T4C_598 [Trichinella pseudospiralis]
MVVIVKKQPNIVDLIVVVVCFSRVSRWSLRRGSKRGNCTSKINSVVQIVEPRVNYTVHWNLIIVIDEEDPKHWSSELNPDRIGYRIGSDWKNRLPDFYHDFHPLKTQNMIAAMRARDELNSRALYENSLPTGKPADAITDLHIFEIEVVKLRIIAEEYLEKDSVTDNRRHTTSNSGASYHFEDQIHRKSELRDTTKFTYLLSCLTGNALNAIDGLAVTAANYSAAIDILKSRFGPRDLIIQTYIRKQLDTIRTKSPPRKKLPSVAALHAETRSSKSCVMCRERHRVSQCPKFLAEKTQDRWRIMTSENLCFHCLRRGHPEHKRCDYPSSGKTWDSMETGEHANPELVKCRLTASEKNLLQTAFAILQSDDGNQFLVICLFDSGCQRSLIRKDLAESLRLRGTTERLALLRLGEMHSKYEKLRGVNFCLKGIYGGEDSYPIEALCVPRITTVDANPSAANWEHLHGLKLADIFPRERTETDRIVGGDALPEAVNSPFGWILSGNIPAHDGSGKCITLLVKTENEYSEDDLRRFWDLEIIGVADDKGKEDPSASRLMKTFDETLEYDNGRYTRLLKTEASLLKDPIKSAMYSKTLRAYITDGIIERVENAHGNGGRTWYLPHHMVFKTDQTSTKGRIELGDQSPQQTFRFRRIFFGLTSSPFLALAVMPHHAGLNKSKWPKAAEEMLKNVYVDDLLFAVDDRTETMKCVKELKQLMETAGFHLTKWSSNEPSVLRSLPEEDDGSESKAKMALGIVWDSKEDIITFPVVSVTRPDQQKTKRGMLSMIMKIFDPLGYLSPFLVKAKHWQDWIAEIPSISEIRLPRCWLPAGNECIKEVELHGYGDASEMAYGSATHVDIEEDRMEVHHTSSAMVWRVLGTFGSVCEDSVKEGIRQNITRRGGVSDSTEAQSFVRCALWIRPNLTKRWRYRKKLIAHFWKRWRSEYIVSFCTRSKWRGDGTEPKVGDIVLIAEDDVNKGRWMMRRRSDVTERVLDITCQQQDVEEKTNSKNNHSAPSLLGKMLIFRTVPRERWSGEISRLKVAKGEITRPTKKLRLLESAVIDRVPPCSKSHRRRMLQIPTEDKT